MDFTWLGTQICICWSHVPSKKVWGVDQITSQYLVWPPFSSWHIYFAYSWLGCWLWPVQCCPTPLQWLCEVAGFWREQDQAVVYTSIQSIPNTLNWWYVGWVCRPWNSVQILATQGHALSCWNMRWWRRMNGTTMGLRISSSYLFVFKLPSINAIVFVVHSLCLPIP